MNNKKITMAIVLSFGLLLGWSLFFPAPNNKSPREIPAAAQAAPGGQPGQAQPAAGPLLEPATPARDIRVTTPLYTAVFTEDGARLKQFTLNKYQANLDKGAPNLEMVTIGDHRQWPLFLSLGSETRPHLATYRLTANQPGLKLSDGESGQLVFSGRLENGLLVTRVFTFKADNYLIDQQVSLANQGPESFSDRLSLTLTSAPVSNTKQYATIGLGAYIDNSFIEKAVKKAGKYLDSYFRENPDRHISWAGFLDQYFLTALTPGENQGLSLAAQRYNDTGLIVTATTKTINLEPNQSQSFDFSFYFGPKNRDALLAAGHNLPKSINYGWFDVITKPLYLLLIWLYKLVGNYGVAIIIVTILIKALFWPLTAKSYKSMKNLQKLQPKIMEIRQKYADDKAAMSRETMQLYKTFKVNPMGGCLPMLIQIPVFIALYRLLSSSLELRQAPFFWWIQDLSAPDRLFSFNITIPLMEAPYGIPVLTILMGASMIIQQRMTPAVGDPTQAKIMALMPIVFTFIFINFPAGLVLYWLVNNILSIGQQALVNRKKS